MLRKYIILCFGLLVFTNCNNESIDIFNNENQEEENNQTSNTLIIKEIDNGDLDFFFDAEGKAERFYDQNAFSPENIRYQFEYNTNNLLTTQTFFYFSELTRTVLAYDNTNPIQFNFYPFGPTFSSEITINNNIISYINTALNRKISLTFSTNNLKQLIHIEITNETLPTTIEDSIDFGYDAEGNFISITENIINEIVENNIYTFSYDDKKNPIAESMSENSLPYLLCESYGYNPHLIQRLIELSPNNILSNSKDLYDFSYEYNSDNYPISGIKTNTTDNTIVNNIIYTYY